MHYGHSKNFLPEGGPTDALEFPARCAQVCVGIAKTVVYLGPHVRVLEVGCGTGRAAFEMARYFKAVTAIDFSHSFINACNELKKLGSLEYEMLVEGEIYEKAVGTVDKNIDRSRVTFEQGDGCALETERLGKFGIILAANLLCRLPKPRLFLEAVPKLLIDGGFLVMPSPYTWLEQFTPKSEWIGGFTGTDGKSVTTFSQLKVLLGSQFELVDDRDMPFLIRETARKCQYTRSHLTVWRKSIPAAAGDA